MKKEERKKNGAVKKTANVLACLCVVAMAAACFLYAFMAVWAAIGAGVSLSSDSLTGSERALAQARADYYNASIVIFIVLGVSSILALVLKILSGAVKSKGAGTGFFIAYCIFSAVKIVSCAAVAVFAVRCATGFQSFDLLGFVLAGLIFLTTVVGVVKSVRGRKANGD